MTLSKAIKQQRKSGIGGSDVGPIFGVSTFKTPLGIYDSKVLDLPDEENDLFWYGHEGEKMIARRIWHDLRKAKRYRGRKMVEPGMVWHPNGWAFANPDRVLIDKKTGDWLEGYECKWITNQFQKWSKDGEEPVRFPSAYYAQAFHYLWVARANGHKLDRWWIVACFGGNDTRYYEVKWCEDFAATLEKVLSFFWFDHVVKRVPPSYTGAKADAKSLNRLFKDEVDETLEASESTESKVQLFRQNQREIKRLEEENNIIKNDLRCVFGSATRIEGSSWASTYKKSKPRRRIDYKAMIKALNISEKEVQKFAKESDQDRTLRINFKGD